MYSYDYLTPEDEPEYQCRVCDKPLHDDKYYCSNDCFKADML